MTTETIAPHSTGRKSDVSLELASVEAALRQIIPSDMEERLLAQIPQWFLVTAMYKNLELDYLVLDDRSKVESKYRAVLTAILSLGESIAAGLEERPTLDLGAIGYRPEVVSANLRYLRGKYRQWFLPRDSAAVDKILALIDSESETSV